MDDHIFVTWISERTNHSVVAKLPKKEFKEFVEENCKLCQLAREIASGRNNHTKEDTVRNQIQ